MELEYREKDGILYPEVEIFPEKKDVGKYGRMAMKYLQEEDEMRYSQLIIEGTLLEIMSKVNEEAHQRVEVILEQLEKEKPLTNPMNTILSYKERMQWQQIAEEIVLNEIVYQIR